MIQVPGTSVGVSSGARSPRYVSPATQSISAVTDPGTANESTFEVDLTTSNPNCAVAGPVAPLTCTVTLPLPAGQHVASFFTYDRPGGSAGNGHILSQNESIPFTVAASGPTQVGVTLDGVPKTILIEPRQGNGHVYPVGTGFGIVGSQPQHFFVSLLDADGYAIIGPGSPAPSITINSPTIVGLTLNAANPLQFLLETKQFSTSALYLTVTATPPAGSGAAVVSTTVPVTTLQELWATASISAGVAEVAGFAVLPGPSLVAVPSDTIPLTDPAFVPQGIAVDPAGTLWVSSTTYGSTNYIEAFTPGTTTPIAADTITVPPINGIHQYPSGLAFDRDGTLWSSNFQGPDVLAYKPGSATPIAADTTPILHSSALAFDAGGTLWVSNQVKVEAFARGSTTPIPGATLGKSSTGFIFGNAQGLAFDSTGELWVADTVKNAIFAFAPGTRTPDEFMTISAGLVSPSDVKVDGNGTLWVANGNGSINAYTPGRDQVRVSLPLGGYFPTFIALSP